MVPKIVKLIEELRTVVTRGRKGAGNEESFFNWHKVSDMQDERSTVQHCTYSQQYCIMHLKTGWEGRLHVVLTSHQYTCIQQNKTTTKNQTQEWTGLLSWLRWWLHRCLHMSKLIKLHILNMCTFWCICTLIKPFKKLKRNVMSWRGFQTTGSVLYWSSGG